MGAKLKHKCGRIFPARNTAAPTILSRKDGTRRVPLAHEQEFVRVFTIQTLGPPSDVRNGHPSFPGVRRIGNLGGTSGCAEASSNHIILTARGASLEELCTLELLWRDAYLWARISSSRASIFSSPSDHNSVRSTGRALSMASTQLNNNWMFSRVLA